MTTETEVGPAPLETVTPIKPSEAIRLGRLELPERHTGTFFGPPGSACVLGAMVRGLGYKGDDDEEGLDLVYGVLPSTVMPFGDIAIPYDCGGSDEDAIAFLESLGL